MSNNLLVTGASGFIGKALTAHLQAEHRVIGMGRGHAPDPHPWVRGDFGSFEDLRQLDQESIDAVIHLAAVTGGCLERDGLLVNVEGTRSLMRYLIDRGCRKFVLASSIAVPGIQSKAFRPLRVPIDDQHPCLDRDGYGLSKYLMEEVARYLHRQNPELDITLLRLSSVCPDQPKPALVGLQPIPHWALGAITLMTRRDAVRAFTCALKAPYRPGLRILNAVGPQSWTSVPVVEMLRHWWGDSVDLGPLEATGDPYCSVYAYQEAEKQIGFRAQDLPHP